MKKIFVAIAGLMIISCSSPETRAGKTDSTENKVTNSPPGGSSDSSGAPASIVRTEIA